MSYYIGNYTGGRNETFMFGSEGNSHWYDFYLVIAYTTAKAYGRGRTGQIITFISVIIYLFLIYLDLLYSSRGPLT